jgi:hypothetical protein
MHQILVNTGSLADILYKSTFELMGIDEDNMTSARFPLVGFTGEQLLPIGSIELLVIARIFPRQRIVMGKILVVDRPSRYNVVIGRTMLNELKAVASIPHLCMKFLTDEGVRIVRDDPTEARYCYNTSLKGLPEWINLRDKTKEDGKYRAQLGEPVEDLEEFEVGDPEKKVRVGSQLAQDIKEKLVAVLHRNRDVFACCHKDMPGINPSVMVHKLNVDPSHRPVKQQRRTFTLE